MTHVENGPVGKALLGFALPVLLSQLLQELYNVTDCLVVGNFGGAYALAATGIAGLLLSVLINFFVGFSSGISVVTSRHFGAYDYTGLRRTMCAVFRLLLAAGAVFGLFAFLSARRLLALLRCPGEVLPHAAVYLRICAVGIPAQLLYNTGAAVARSLGDTKAPLRCFAVSAACNLALDLLLVVGFHMGVAGAAAATLASQMLLAACMFLHLTRLPPECALSLRGDALDHKELLGVLRLGLPAGMQALFMSASSLLIQTQIDAFGSAAIAGMTLYAKLEGIVYLPTFAYGIALTAFVGQNCGAGQPARIREAVRRSLRLTWAIIFPLSLLIACAAAPLLRLFTADAAIARCAREAVVWNLPFYVIYAINQVYLGAVKGLGDTSGPMLCTLLCYSVFRVVWCRALIPLLHSMRVVYLSYDVSFFLMLALLLPMYRRAFRRAGFTDPAPRDMPAMSPRG